MALASFNKNICEAYRDMKKELHSEDTLGIQKVKSKISNDYLMRDFTISKQKSKGVSFFEEERESRACSKKLANVPYEHSSEKTYRSDVSNLSTLVLGGGSDSGDDVTQLCTSSFMVLKEGELEQNDNTAELKNNNALKGKWKVFRNFRGKERIVFGENNHNGSNMKESKRIERRKQKNAKDRLKIEQKILKAKMNSVRKNAKTLRKERSTIHRGRRLMIRIGKKKELIDLGTQVSPEPSVDDSCSVSETLPETRKHGWFMKLLRNVFPRRKPLRELQETVFLMSSSADSDETMSESLVESINRNVSNKDDSRARPMRIVKRPMSCPREVPPRLETLATYPTSCHGCMNPPESRKCCWGRRCGGKYCRHPGKCERHPGSCGNHTRHFSRLPGRCSHFPALCKENSKACKIHLGHCACHKCHARLNHKLHCIRCGDFSAKGPLSESSVGSSDDSYIADFLNDLEQNMIANVNIEALYKRELDVYRAEEMVAIRARDEHCLKNHNHSTDITCVHTNQDIVSL